MCLNCLLSAEALHGVGGAGRHARTGCSSYPAASRRQRESRSRGGRRGGSGSGGRGSSRELTGQVSIARTESALESAPQMVQVGELAEVQLGALENSDGLGVQQLVDPEGVALRGGRSGGAR